MNDNITWAEAIAQADHRLAIGATDVYLGTDKWDGLDWSKCIGMDTGGSHRLDISTSVQFKFRDKGLTGRWYFDIEPHSANGSGHYHIDVKGLQRLMGVLPENVRYEFAAYLLDCAEKVDKSADNYQEIAAKEYGMAAAMRSAANLAATTNTSPVRRDD